MSLELNSVLRLECRPGDVQDLKDAIAQFPADDPYAATARALLTAYTTVELAKKEANKLKVQITTLNDLLAQEGGRAKDLQAKVYAVIKEKNVALSAREADERKIQTLKDSLAHEQARADALQGAADEAKAAGERDMQTMKETHSREMDTLRTSSAQDRDAYQQMQNWIVGRCSAFEAERNAARQGIFEIIRQQLDQIPHFLPPDPISAATQSTPAPSAGQKHPTSGNVSVAPKRPRTESNPKSTNQPDTSVAKRPRMDSSPTRTIASATSPTAPGKLGFGAQLGLAQAQRPAGSGQHQPPLSPVSRSNIGPFHTSPRDPRLAPGYKQQASKSYGNRTHRPSNTSERQV